MKKKIDATKHSMKMMWGCVIFAIVAIILVANGVGGGAFFLIPCMVMMGAMMWMMMAAPAASRAAARSPARRTSRDQSVADGAAFPKRQATARPEIGS